MTQTAEYDYTDFQDSKRDSADATLLVKFYYHPYKDLVASAAEGRPIFVDKEYIDIRVPGQRDSVNRRANARDKARFPRHYKAFKERIEMPIEGTPLAEWPAISRSLADELAFRNIKTVEQLAELNDNLMHNIHGAQNFKQKAKDWLLRAKDDSVIGKMRDELTARDVTIAEQAALLQGAIARIESLENPEPEPTTKKKKKE